MRAGPVDSSAYERERVEVMMIHAGTLDEPETEGIVRGLGEK